jgi:hypothetical protein
LAAFRVKYDTQNIVIIQKMAKFYAAHNYLSSYRIGSTSRRAPSARFLWGG